MEGPFRIIFQDKIFDPYFNLASEEFLLKNQKESSNSNVLFVYRNKPSVVCGKNQSVLAEVNLKYCRENGISINKRVSGGGTVYHDLGNLNFSYFTRRKSEWVSNFKIFNDPIIEFLNSNGIEAHSNDRNDILIDNFKISGNAQHLSGDQMISHATLLYDANLTSVSAALNHKYETVKSTAIQSKKVPVTNIRQYGFDLSMGQFIDRFLKYMKDALNGELRMGFEKGETDEIEKIAQAKYSREDWVYGNSPKTEITIALPHHDKTHSLRIYLEKGRVNDFDISPKDKDLSEILSGLLMGELFSHNNLSNKISQYNKNEQEKLNSVLSNLNL